MAIMVKKWIIVLEQRESIITVFGYIIVLNVL